MKKSILILMVLVVSGCSKVYYCNEGEIQESLNMVEEYINSNGTDLEKEAFIILKEFMENDEEISIKDSNKNVEEFKDRLEKLVEKNNKNEKF